MFVHKSKTILNGKLLTILLLGFSSGLPLTLTSSTLQAWFTQADIDLFTIGSLTLLGIPYTLKFLWAPLFDHYHVPLFGKRKTWILLMQLGVAIGLLTLAQLEPKSQAFTMSVIALLVAFFSASQDISVTAYQTETLGPQERGLGAAYYIFTYRIAMLMAGGFALIFADYFSWKLTYELMAGLIFASMLLTLKAPDIIEAPLNTNNLFATIKVAFTNLLTRDKIAALLLFIVLYKIGDALALSLMSNFLLKGLGFTLTEVGLSYKVVSFVATVLGAFVGGAILIRWDIYRALLVFGIAQALSNLTFVVLAMVGKHFMLMTSSLFIENFCSGMSTAALMAFMMSLCEKRFSASQFALLSAIASLGRVFLGPPAAMLVENVGWVQFYLLSFLLCIPGLVLLVSLKSRVSTYATAISN